jgi:hypothetical protein
MRVCYWWLKEQQSKKEKKSDKAGSSVKARRIDHRLGPTVSRVVCRSRMVGDGGQTGRRTGNSVARLHAPGSNLAFTPVVATSSHLFHQKRSFLEEAQQSTVRRRQRCC